LKTLPRIAIVEDHSFYRNGLCLAIKRFKFAELAFEASNGQEFLEKQRKYPADIALMDVMMPVMNGYETALQAKKEFPGLKIIILTMLDEDDTIQQFIQAEVQGYLLKNIDYKRLETALKAVINGQNYYSEELMGYFTRKLRSDHANSRKKVSLTKREQEILQMVFEGLSNQEIADKLFISIRTVTNHRFNLNVKTGAKNTAGLISYGLKNKIIH
jgi:DNA-binding NarL/FixJ family response regulator